MRRGSGVESRSGAGGSEVGYDRGVPVEQAFTLVINAAPKARPKCPLSRGPGCDGVRVWHKLGRCIARRTARPRKPLNGRAPERARAILCRDGSRPRGRSCTAYLNRKVRERGWEGRRAARGGAPGRAVGAPAGLSTMLLYALSKSRSLSERGYGAGAGRQSLRAAGIEEEDGAAAHELAAEEAASRCAAVRPAAADRAFCRVSCPIRAGRRGRSRR